MDRNELKEKMRTALGIEHCPTCSDSGLCLNDYCNCAEEVETVLSAIEQSGCTIVTEKHWNAALSALKSYEYGNSSPELAEEILRAIAPKGTQ